jgi:hypothetical protein
LNDAGLGRELRACADAQNALDRNAGYTKTFAETLNIFKALNSMAGEFIGHFRGST